MRRRRGLPVVLLQHQAKERLASIRAGPDIPRRTPEDVCLDELRVIVEDILSHAQDKELLLKLKLVVDL
jgi:hypothetical protein